MEKKEFSKQPAIEDFNKYFDRDPGRVEELGTRTNFLDIAPEVKEIREKIKFCITQCAENEEFGTYRGFVVQVAREYVEKTHVLFDFKGGDEAVIRSIKAGIKEYFSEIYRAEDKYKLLLIYNTIKIASQQVVLGNLGADGLKELKKEFERKLGEITEMATDLKKIGTESAAAQQSNAFGELIKQHGGLAKKWLVGMVCALAVFVVVVLFVYNKTILPEIDDRILDYFNMVLAIALFKNMLLASVPLIAFKVCLGKYNAERHLEIIYTHRVDTLKLSNYFHAILRDDSQNMFILELVKYMFSDPATGYLGDTEMKELNINPLLNVVDKVKKQS